MNMKAMYKFSYGLFVLTTAHEGKDNGCIINTAIQAASEPNQISIAVNKANYTHDLIMESMKFNVSVLGNAYEQKNEDLSADPFKAHIARQLLVSYRTHHPGQVIDYNECNQSVKQTITSSQVVTHPSSKTREHGLDHDPKFFHFMYLLHMTFHSSFVGGCLLRLAARSAAQNKSAHPKGTPITTPMNNEIMQLIAYFLPVQIIKLIPIYGGLFSCD